MIKLNGIFPPLPSSFNSDEGLAHDRIANNIRLLNQFNLSGFLLLGSNGELVHLSENEKLEIYDKGRAAIPSDKIMLAGTGGQSTRETIFLCKSAARYGADAVLVITPGYYKGLMNQEALVSHYNAIADSSPCPVIIYNMPANTGLDLDADTIVRISSHDNIIGLKDSGGDLVKMGNVINHAKEGFQVLAGSAGFLLPALSIGAVGGILALANIAPNQCISIYNDFIEGKLEKARKLQLALIEINTAVTRKWGIPALKASMDHLGLYGGPARQPVQSLDEHIRIQLFKLIEQSGIKIID